MSHLASNAEQASAAQQLPEQYLTFELAGETYAIDSLCVREIIEYPLLTRVPSAGRAIKGVINLRGSVVPVIDLAVRFGRGQTAINRRTCVIILEVRDEDEALVLGIIVDAVSEVLEVAASDLRQAPAFGSHIRADFIHAMARVDDRFVVLLSIEQVLSAHELGATSLSSNPN
ncbi:chemotaxis protein CheW [Stutzerimonas azotifigens]|uniref:chemotaxis protein CheW n=1 Tax=Stutzerimonas azotifigens TaxID=291995 RepID=UPI0015E39FDC|nr:chemotaxis protein CheW [Stutzerimonas azotifigens]